MQEEDVFRIHIIDIGMEWFFSKFFGDNFKNFEKSYF